MVELSYQQREVAIRERDFGIVRITRAVGLTNGGILRQTVSYEPTLLTDAGG